MVLFPNNRDIKDLRRHATLQKIAQGYWLLPDFKFVNAVSVVGQHV